MGIKEYIIMVHADDAIVAFDGVRRIFVEKKLNIKTVQISNCEIERCGSLRLTVNATNSYLDEIVSSVKKLGTIYKVKSFAKNTVFAKELGIYKIKTERLLENDKIEGIMEKYKAQFEEVTREYFIISKVGPSFEVTKLLEILKPFGLLEFSRSGGAFVPYRKGISS